MVGRGEHLHTDTDTDIAQALNRCLPTTQAECVTSRNSGADVLVGTAETRTRMMDDMITMVRPVRNGPGWMRSFGSATRISSPHSRLAISLTDQITVVIARLYRPAVSGTLHPQSLSELYLWQNPVGLVQPMLEPM